MLKLTREGNTSYLQDHNLLKNLDAKDQHPIKAIEGLREELDKDQPISHIIGLREELDSKYVKPSDGIPLSDLAEVVLTQIKFAEFFKQYLTTIEELLDADKDLMDYIKYVDASLTNFKKDMEKYLREIDLMMEELTTQVTENTKAISSIKDEILSLKKDIDELIDEVLDQLSLNEQMIHEVEELKHMILNLNRSISIESKRITKNSADIQKLAEAHKELLRKLETGDICDDHILNSNKECNTVIGRTTIEQIDKVNVKAGYMFEIKTKDNNLRVIEPTILKLSVDDTSGVDILSDFDYNNREDFIATDSVIIKNGIRLTDEVILQGKFKEANNGYDLYCYEALDTKPYEDVMTLKCDDGFILIENKGATIRYLNSRLEVRYMDLSSSIMEYEEIEVYGNSNIDLNLSMAYRRLDFKVRNRSVDGLYGEYEIPAALIDFSKELVIKSQEECFDEYR